MLTENPALKAASADTPRSGDSAQGDMFFYVRDRLVAAKFDEARLVIDSGRVESMRFKGRRGMNAALAVVEHLQQLNASQS